MYILFFHVWISLSEVDAESKRIYMPDLVSVKSFGSLLI